VGVGEAGAVEDVFKPGAAGDAVGVKPVALDLHHAAVESGREFGIDGGSCQFNVQVLRRLPRVSPPAGDGTPTFSGESHPAIPSGSGKVACGALLQQAMTFELGSHNIA